MKRSRPWQDDTSIWSVTRHDTPIELLQAQIDRRFNEIKVLGSVELGQRDKAIELLTKTLEQRVNTGDENLRQHIVNQVEQIKQALDAANTLMQAHLGTLEQRIRSVHREIDIEALATRTAVQKAETATEKRFESVNEFRAQMADQATLFITRREVEAVVGSNAEKVVAITDRINRSEGRGAGMSQFAGWIFGGVGFIVGLIAIFTWIVRMEPTINRNTEFRERAQPAIEQSR